MASAPASRPQLLLLDVNETLSDLRPLTTRLLEVGAPAELLDTWFAATLRDGISLALTGGFVPFPELGRGIMVTLLTGRDGLSAPSGEAAEHVLAGLGELPLHPDVASALPALQRTGIRLVALTNGAAEGAAALLARGGVGECVEQVLSVDAVRRWKPAPEPYRYALSAAGVAAGDAMMVAVHPWDLQGARGVGLRACWINRRGEAYPPAFNPPELTCRDFAELADRLVP